MSVDPELYRTGFMLVSTDDWEDWADFPGREIRILDLGTVEVVHTEKDTRTVGDYYEGFGSGSTAPAGIVFKVTYEDGSVRFWKKDGEYDSYGRSNYRDGSFFEVSEIPKTITEYKRV
jgi:hypothetical protein